MTSLDTENLSADHNIIERAEKIAIKIWDTRYGSFNEMAFDIAKILSKYERLDKSNGALALISKLKNPVNVNSPTIFPYVAPEPPFKPYWQDPVIAEYGTGLPIKLDSVSYTRASGQKQADFAESTRPCDTEDTPWVD